MTCALCANGWPRWMLGSGKFAHWDHERGGGYWMCEENENVDSDAIQRLEHKSGGYMEGWIAGENGDERRCTNPWDAHWLVDWYRGYDDAVAASRRGIVNE